jgi:hypothetical protein
MAAQQAWADALEAGGRAAATLRQQGQHAMVLPVLINNARLARMLDDPEVTLRWAQLAADTANYHGSPDERAHAIFQLGSAQWDNGNDDGATTSFDEAGVLFEQQDSLSNAAVAAGNAAAKSHSRAEKTGRLRTAAKRWGGTEETERHAYALVSLSAALAADSDYAGATVVLGQAADALAARACTSNLSVEIEMRLLALLLLDKERPDQIRQPSITAEAAAAANYSSEFGILDDLRRNAGSLPDPHALLQRIVCEEPRNGPEPYDAWFFRALGSQTPARAALESGRALSK